MTKLTLQECIAIEAAIPPGMPFADMTPEQLYAWHRVEYYGWTGEDFDDLVIDDNFDGLLTCHICRDRYTTNRDGICDSCKHQQWLDENA